MSNTGINGISPMSGMLLIANSNSLSVMPTSLELELLCYKSHLEQEQSPHHKDLAKSA